MYYDNDDPRRVHGRHGRQRLASADRVSSEFLVPAYTMTQHLIDAGHRRIAMLAGPDNLPWVRERAEGYQSAMTEAGLEPLVSHCAFHTGTEAAERCLRELLDPRPRVSAVCTGAGDLTLVVLAVVQQMQMRMPSDLALAGFDDYPYFEYISPPITAVSQPFSELGQAALDMLFTLMDGKEPDSRKHYCHKKAYSCQ